MDDLRGRKASCIPSTASRTLFSTWCGRFDKHSGVPRTFATLTAQRLGYQRTLGRRRASSQCTTDDGPMHKIVSLPLSQTN